VSDSDIPQPGGVSGTHPHGGAAPLEAPAALTALMTGPSWQEQDAKLREMWLQNKTPQEISDELNRSVAAIMTRAARLGLPRRAAPGRKPGSRRVGADGSPVRAAPPRSVSRLMREGVETPPQASARICLMCLRSFQSMGRHNRICSSCKNSSEYQAAAQTADIHLPV
jgi:hypothetical protein